MPEHSPNIIDLDIRIFKAGDEFTVTAQTPDSGLAKGQLDADALFDDGLQEKLLQIREEPFTTDAALFQEVGDALFRALFREQIRDLFLAVWSQQVQSNEENALRLRLNIDEAAIEVARLPWEMMHWRGAFLATQINTLVTRQILDMDYGDIKSLTVEGLPRVLIVIPRASGLDTDAEERAISAALDKAGVPYDVLKGKTPLQALDDALAEKDYAILHFIGHAQFEQDEAGAVSGSLRFNSADDLPAEEDEDWVPDTDLQSLLGNYRGLKLVVLNACHTGEVGPGAAQQGFWGVIPATLRAGIPAVAAMQYAIRDDVAALFGEIFYKRLTSGKWVGRVDIAVTLARNACLLAFPDDRGFATPTLYLRSRDGVIFELTKGKNAADGETADASCEKPPKPSGHLLYRYRNLDIEALDARQPLLKSRLQRVMFQIDELKSRGALDEKSAWRLHRYEKNRDDLEREMDELQDVLAWRRYETCEELRALRKQLADKNREKEALEAAGAYISYDLKNTIFKLNERILKLQELLEAPTSLQIEQ